MSEEIKRDEAVIKAIEKKSDKNGNPYVVITAQSGKRYSAFAPKGTEGAEPDAEQIAKWELLTGLKWGNKLTLMYRENHYEYMGKPRVANNVIDFEGFSAGESPQVDKTNGGDKMSKADWDKKDRMIGKESVASSIADLFQRWVTPESDPEIVLKTYLAFCAAVYEWVRAE